MAGQSISAASNGGQDSQEAADACYSFRRDTQRLTRGEAATLSHDTLPQDVKSIRTLLQKKTINNMRVTIIRE